MLQSELLGTTQPLPEGFVYEPDFITAADKIALLAAIRDLPLQEAKYKAYTAKRRIMGFGPGHDFEKNALNPGPPMPPFLLPLRDQVAGWLNLSPSRFVHALLTEYRPGTALGWHRDSPDYAVVVDVSLGGWYRMRFRPFLLALADRETIFALDLAPRSVYVLQGAIRWRWQHSIPTTKELRYSVTFRTLFGQTAY